jgi:hypothetical protein
MLAIMPPAEIKVSEITWQAAIRVQFGEFSSLSVKQAQQIMRGIISASWPKAQRLTQRVYVIRLTGEVAIHYPKGASPVVYIGEGDAYSRLYNHTHWLVPLVRSIPQIGVEVRVARIRRTNQPNLYKNVEADLIRRFSNEYGAIPWFNKQWEPSKEDKYNYTHGAAKDLWKSVAVGSGNSFHWAIRPTPINEQHGPYMKGVVKA